MQSENLQLTIDGQQGFAVIPKKDCPHVVDSMTQNLDDALTSLRSTLVSSPCRDCQDPNENWFCMKCGCVFCSRYVNKHMSLHFEETKHEVGFSLSDGSFWCYKCEAYITNPQLEYLQSRFSILKFPDE